MAKLTGTTGNDTLLGGTAADVLTGLAGNDSIDAGSGADVINEGLNSGNDTIIGGAGVDTVTYNDGNKQTPLTLNLHAGTTQLGGQTDVLIEIEKVIGTKGTQDVLSADGDEDGVTVDLKSGVIAGAASGIALAQLFEHFTGGSGNDQIIGNASANRLFGGDGNDTILASGAADTMDGGEGNDIVSFLNQKSVTLDLAQGRMVQGKLITTLYNVETIWGTNSALDVITAASDTEGVTVDLLSGQVSSLGSAIQNVLYFEHIVGGSGNDSLSGNNANNSLTGGFGSDSLSGNAGDDTFLESGVTGSDTLVGGDGNDTVIYDEKGKPPAITLDLVAGTVARGEYTDTLRQIEKVVGIVASTADVISALDDTDGVTINLLLGTVSGSNIGITSLLNFDHVLGGSAKDVLTGGKGHNRLEGNGGNDSLSGDAGNDTLIGGEGADTMVGGAGNDLYVVDSASDVVIEAAKGGTDTVQANHSYTLGDNIENLSLNGSENLVAVGNSMNNVLTGNNGDNTLNGMGGNDTMIGGLGNDTYMVDQAKDVIRESADSGEDTVISSLSYTLSANLENLILTGTGNLNATGSVDANYLTGNSGNNILDGKAGADTMSGGLGDDTYFVDNDGDVIIELENAGTDKVQSSISYTLSDHLENLVLTGNNAINGTGNSLNNVITGNAANNTLDGGEGADTLIGGGGDDTYILSNASQVITELANAGTDTVNASFSYTLGANLENLVLTGEDDITGTGNSAANKITGNSGNNTLDGSTGADTMIGGDGDDFYFVDILGDRITENLNEGNDTVQSTVSFTLGANLENLILAGTNNLYGTGNALDNHITGNSGNNTLSGGEGSDTLMGGAGNDSYAGFLGLAAQHDVIDDESGTADVLNLSNFNFTLVTFDAIDADEDGLLDALVIDLGNDRSVTIRHYFDSSSDSIETSGAGTGNIETLIFSNGNLNFQSVKSLFTTVVPTDGDDSLTGTSGNDTMDGLEGNDTLVGLEGNDSYIVDTTTDVLVELENQGTDTVVASVSYTLANYFENLTLTGDEDLDATGNAANNVLSGNSGNNTLNGLGGIDTLAGGLGDDVYLVDTTTDLIQELENAGTDTVMSQVSYTLAANIENLILVPESGDFNATGNASNNQLTGNTGNNLLNGMAGADTMSGDLGDDTYIVDQIGDVIIENEDEGTDGVQSSISWTLAENLENLTLTGTANLAATGNDADNRLVGNSGNNTLDGGLGADTMNGGLGNDVYYVDHADDFILEIANGGTDTVYSSVSMMLGEFVENLVLTGSDNLDATGSEANNRLTGNSGDNSLDGSEGNDTMVGGAGNDVYFVDSLEDVITELTSEGEDTVYTGISFSLSDNVENLILTGDDDLSATGNSLANSLTGNIGNNTLNGGAGADTMTGDAGDDLYFVDNVDDVVIEEEDGGEDGIIAAVSFTLGDYLENLGLAGDADLSATGNLLDNFLTGNEGDNTLDGSFGDDTMMGGEGDDTYFVDSDGDIIVEGEDEGTDTVYSNVSMTLADNIENLVLLDPEAIAGTGNQLNNSMIGNMANNTLDGGEGDDTLAGGEGDDLYMVDSLTDTLIENADEGVDTVESSVSFTLGEGFENLVLSGIDDIMAAGNDADNSITGNEGNNTLQGGGGADTLAGGLGDDVYYVTSDTELLVENENEGLDTVYSTVSYTLTDHFENLVLTGSEHLDAAGNNLDNELTGNDGNNLLEGSFGNDTMTGGLGDDTYIIDELDDLVIENADEGNDTVESWISHTLGNHLENLTLLGTQNINASGNLLDNLITGNKGDNILFGDEGEDTLVGGDGNDTYILLSDTDTLIETDDGGTDTVQAAMSYTLGEYLENLTLTGSEDLHATGNSLDNFLAGNSGNNTLDGLTGNDTMQGGSGNDLYVVDASGDTIVENADEGLDSVESSVSYTLGDHLENLTLVDSGQSGTGNALDNLITGNSLDNILAGLLGNDTLVGGSGNDLYQEFTGDVFADVIQDAEGLDTLDLSTYTLEEFLPTITADGDLKIFLGAGKSITIENYFNNSLAQNEGTGLIETIRLANGIQLSFVDVKLLIPANQHLIGTDGNDTLIGGMGNDTLEGLAGRDSLIGSGGDNTLNGGEGADTYAGGGGDDTYIIDDADDLILADSGGLDVVYSQVSWTLAETLEDLVLTGSGMLNATGNSANNRLTGNSSHNILDGGSGADTLTGGLGDDIYIVDHTGDTVIEQANAGVDWVYSSVSHTLAANLENLQLSGSTSINGTGNSLNNSLIGNSGNNTLNGGEGADTMSGGNGDDTYVVDNTNDYIVENNNAGTDTVMTAIAYTLGDHLENLSLTGAASIAITGNTLNNILTGNTGNNTLDGSTGADTMNGGLGDDLYFVDHVDDLVQENSGEGVDSVMSSVSYTLGNTIEHLTLIGSDVLSATGNTLNNSLVGNNANNTLDGGTGADTMQGGLGNDFYVVDMATDVVVENTDEGTDTIQTGSSYTLGNNIENLSLTGTGNINGIGNSLNNELTGNTGSNSLSGGNGNDTLNGGAGNDTMSGGLDNDVYFVDSSLDVVVESNNQGSDTIMASLSYTLANYLENLTLLETGDFDGTGNSLNNAITGNSGNNILNGSTGSDTLRGGLGDDTYVIDNIGDNIEESANAGTDTVQSSISYTLGSHFENLILSGSSSLIGYGNSAHNSLMGNNGNNTLDGGLGDDTMSGGTGNDIYYVDSIGDVVIENENAGTDRILTGVNYTLAANIEHLTLTGTGDIIAVGNALNNTLMGNSGNNILDGGAGNDTLYGGAGNDTYYIDSASDVISESASAGTDTILSTISYTMGNNLENITLMGSEHLNIRGNSLGNIMTGNAGNNSINGSTGNDTMLGAQGDDIYVVDAVGDIVSEYTDEGTDTVQSSITYTLGANLENLTLTGTGVIHATGNGLDNTLVGNTKNNSVSGAAGNDTLDGGSGNDTLTGGSGDDRLIGNLGNDSYIGFSSSSGRDVIDDISGTDSATFSGLSTGNATWSAIDGDDSDNFVDQLLIDFGNGFSVTILNYFSNTHTDDDFSLMGAGAIESLVFSNDSNVTFLDVQSLIQ